MVNILQTVKTRTQYFNLCLNRVALQISHNTESFGQVTGGIFSGNNFPVSDCNVQLVYTYPVHHFIEIESEHQI
jgi:hypothetical protein